MKIILIFVFLLQINVLFCQDSFTKQELINFNSESFKFIDSIPTPSIIMYYAEPVCSSCVDEILNKINEYKYKNFYIIVEDRNDVFYRKKKIKDFFIKSNNLKAIYFYNKENNFSFVNLNIKNSPYLILYNKKNQIFEVNDIFNDDLLSLTFKNYFLIKLEEFINLKIN